MIGPKEAWNNVAKQFPSRTPKSIFDYDDEHYIISAPLNGVKKDRNGCFFGVDKTSGKVVGFSPFYDYEKFSDAIANREIKV